jgi:monofunctional biosynthetic peptidoglycan transglycosylase
MDRVKTNRIKRLFNKVILFFFASTIGAVLVLKFVPVPVTLTMLGQWASVGKLNYDWEPIEKISPEMAIAVVAAEDQLFPKHNGFDIKSIKKALDSNQKNKKVRGASTISQQTAKNVFLWQGRNWIRKGLEAYFTLLIELIWGKERILEVYLNVSEMGPGIFGAQAAAQSYFKINASKLSRWQSARIAGVLPSPRKWKVNNAGSYVQRRTDRIVRQIRQLGGPAYIKDI